MGKCIITSTRATLPLAKEQLKADEEEYKREREQSQDEREEAWEREEAEKRKKAEAEKKRGGEEAGGGKGSPSHQNLGAEGAEEEMKRAEEEGGGGKGSPSPQNLEAAPETGVQKKSAEVPEADVAKGNDEPGEDRSAPKAAEADLPGGAVAQGGVAVEAGKVTVICIRTSLIDARGSV